VDFEWDSKKARTNLRKHEVSFEEAAEAFGDDHSLTVPDPDHSIGEGRFLLFGMTSKRQFVVVGFTERDGRSGPTTHDE